MLKHARALGSCALTGLLVLSLPGMGIGSFAEADEAVRPEALSVSLQKPVLADGYTVLSDKAAPENDYASNGSGESDNGAVGQQSVDAAESASSSETASGQDAASDSETSSVTVEGSTLYANGIAICIARDVDGKVYVFNADKSEKLVESPYTPSTVYGGGKGVSVQGDTSIAVEGVNIGTVYGGGYNAQVGGNTNVSAASARIGTLYGGGYSDGTAAADVSGNATVTVTGTTDAPSVHGGGYAYASKGSASANVGGKATVSITAQPTRYHGNLYGGGNAVALYGNSANASVGSVRASVVGTTYSLRGGGSAGLGYQMTGTATADVKGAIELSLDGVDVREVYGAGYASGEGTHATAGSVSLALNGNEAMIVVGGGSASNAGVADVAGSVALDIRACSNLYGYIYGGGDASSGGKARVGSTSVSVRNSSYPVDEQFEGYYAAGATIAGGSASGEGSDASVLGPASLTMTDIEGGGNIYGGSEASKGGRATSGDVNLSLTRISETEYDGISFSCSVFSGGEVDDPQASNGAPASVSVSVEDCAIEHLWGGYESSGNPVSTSCTSKADLVGSNNVVSTLTCFDAVSLSSPLHIAAFLGKSDDVSTELSVTGIAQGDPVIVCDDADSAATWFSRVGGALDYAVEDVDGSPASVWRMGADASEPVPIPPDPVPIPPDPVPVPPEPVPTPDDVVIVEPSDPAMPEVTIENGEGLSEALLTDEDREAMAHGSTVAFSVTVDPLEEPPAEEAAIIEQAFAEQGVELGMYLDIKLVKSVDGVETPMTSTSSTGSSLRFKIEIPDALATDERMFSVMRFHEEADGSIEAALLEDLDQDPATVTFETDRFSVYSLVYAEEAPVNPDDPSKPDGGGDSDGSDGSESGSDGSNGGSGAGSVDGADGADGAGDTGSAERSARKPAIGTFPTTGDAMGDAALLAAGVVVLFACILGASRLRMRSSHRR